MNEKGTRTGTSSPVLSLSRIVRHKDVSIVLLTAVLITIFSVANGQFLSQENLFVMLKTMPELGLIAIGMTMLIIAGEFDLSVGSTFALSPFIMAYLTEKAGIDPIIAFLVGIASGVAIGFLNGIITTKIGIPSFITTLGTMMAFRGVILLASAGFPEAYDRQRPISQFFTTNVSGFPVQFFWFVGAAIVIWVILENHRFGNWTYVTGGNRNASVSMGIPVDRVKIFNFMIVGGLAAFAGAIQVFRMGSAYSNAGQGLELSAIAATVIGGTMLSGGAGTIVGTVMGTILLFTVENILILSRVPAFWFRFFVGVIVIVAVTVHILIQGRRRNG
ncbi:MAG: ABC transporter permease [Acidobacteria bacterium]|nr:ABC transporter permease [Acidobacteriota bacterium]